MDSRNTQLSTLLQHSPILLLPCELLREVFSLLASQGLFHLRHALLVCKRWHNVIVNDKKLWSTIIIDEEVVDRFKLHSKTPEISRASAYIRACLDRSAPLPLDITLSALESKHGEHCCSVLDELLNSGEPRHIQRCRSLFWCIGYTLYDRPILSTLLPPSLERLEYLYLQDFTFHRGPPIRFPQCPQLKEVRLVNHFEGVSPHYLVDRDHTHVEKLTFTRDFMWIDHDIPCIQSFHAIRTLVLEVTPRSFSAYIFLEEVENTSIAHLHCLETLELLGPIPLGIMQRLHAPSLRRVEIAASYSDPHSHALNTVPLVLLQPVTEMEIWICLLDDEIETLPHPQQLRRVICGAPSLTSIFGSLAIRELLAGEEWFRERNIVCHPP